MVMLFRTLISSFALCCAASAYAENSGSFSTVSLEHLRAKCTEFAANPQMKTVNVQLACGEHTFYWTAGKPTAGSLKNTRTISVGAKMKSYEVKDITYPAASDDTAVDCQSFDKIEKSVSGIEVDL